MAAEIIIEGDIYPLGEQRELVLFRIFQEGLNNTLKYSGARLLKIGLQYRPEMFNLSLLDDGIGFSIQSPENLKGSGLRNMESRATIIGAKATINSTPGKGCKINICLNPLEQHIYAVMEPIQIALVDDHRLFRSGIASLINNFEGFNVIFEVGNGEELITKISDGQKPKIVLLDIHMPVMDGAYTARWLKNKYPEIAVIVLSMNEDAEKVLEMLKIGIKGLHA